MNAQSFIPTFGSIQAFDQSIFKSIDTSFSSIHQYSIIQKDFYTDLGNPGTSAKNLIFESKVLSGFNTGIKGWEMYFDQNKTNEFWNVKRPYSDIKYVQGQNRLLGLNFIHTQNIRKDWNVGVEIIRYGSKGFYLRQNSDISRLRLFQSYLSNDGRSRLLASIILDKALQEVNGGIVNTKDFDSSSILQRESYPINLSKSFNYLKKNQVMFEYSYGFKKFSIRVDSNSRKALYPFRIYYTFQRDKEAYLDTGLADDTKYYKNIYKDSLVNFDSTSFITFKNHLQLASLGYKKLNDSTFSLKPLIWQVGYQYDFIKFFCKDYTSGSIVNHSINLKILYAFKPNMKFITESKYYFNGYNRQDYLQQATFLLINKKVQLNLNGFAQQYIQPLIYQYFKTNYFAWSQSLNPTHVLGFNFYLKTNFKHPFEVNILYRNTVNYVYFDQNSIPTQFAPSLTHLSAVTALDWHYKKLHIKEKLLLQYNSNTQITPLPNWASKTDIYIAGQLKNKSMKYHIGFSINYWQKTSSYRWNTSIMQFYLDSSVKSGGYPMIDLYANGEIQRFAFFVKLEHVFYGLRFLADPWQQTFNFLPNSYYATAYNPMQPQVLRLGFRWRFYD